MGYAAGNIPWAQLVSRLKHLFVVTDMTEAKALPASLSNPSAVYYTTDSHKIVVAGNVYGWGKADGMPYAVCDASSTSTKVTATVPGITALKTGTVIILKNSGVASASGWTLNVNGLGAKNVYVTTATATRSTTQFAKDYTMMFIYDESLNSGAGGWRICQLFNSNTTYSAMSQSEANTGTATTGRLMTAKVLHDTISNRIAGKQDTSDYLSTEELYNILT